MTRFKTETYGEGTKETGAQAKISTEKGEVTIEIRYDKDTGKDRFTVLHGLFHPNGIWYQEQLLDGVIGEENLE